MARKRVAEIRRRLGRLRDTGSSQRSAGNQPVSPAESASPDRSDVGSGPSRQPPAREPEPSPWLPGDLRTSDAPSAPARRISDASRWLPDDLVDG
jgi:hypothetical protein